MKIDSSAITMASERSYSSHYEEQTLVQYQNHSKAATLEISDASKEKSKNLIEESAKQQADNAEQQVKTNASKNKEFAIDADVASELEVRLKTMIRMLEMLRKVRKGGMGSLSNNLEQLWERFNGMTNQGNDIPTVTGSPKNAGRNIAQDAENFTPWTKKTVKSAFYEETENTAYTAQGIVKTADGREIAFDVQLEMSRAFCSKYEETTFQSYVLTDPLVINLDTPYGTVTDQKYLFDIDSDGEKDEISFVGEGSGFLTLDKNKDGIVNDGNELFGTKSGDGFKDLAAYDEDGNGWIDENDDAFDELKVWMKDKDGKDILLNLKEADVGAIYLGNVSTEFSLNNIDTNRTNGVVKSTGVFLKESGSAGTIQHIDLAV